MKNKTTLVEIEQNCFDGLVDNISQVHDVLQGCAARSINQFLSIRNWIFGYYIVEYEQNGEDRAKYGEKLIASIASKLKHIKGITNNQLYVCVNFYQTYPYFLQTLFVKLQALNLGQDTILRTLSVKLQNTDSEGDIILRTLSVKSDTQIRGTVSPELQNTDNEDNTILRSLTAKSDSPILDAQIPRLFDNNRLHPEYLLSRLNFSHFIELIRISDPLQRLFYEVETIKNNWSVRELKRAITTQLAFRTTMSTNKDAIIAKVKNLRPTTNAEMIKHPLSLEFLDIEEKSEYSETDLEQQIITHLQQFLIELGTGFCFESRQKRITFNNKHYRIDLVFYHRILKCHVLIDLKTHEFDHADAGQMNLYLNYFKTNEMYEDDNPPVGIILCADKDDTLVEYSTAGLDDHLFVSKYLVNLPKKQVLEDFIRREIYG